MSTTEEGLPEIPLILTFQTQHAFYKMQKDQSQTFDKEHTHTRLCK